MERPADQTVLSDLGIRFISTDRPGHGLSDPHPNRTLLGWADDVRELADHLRVEKFNVLGWSAGGPHALACAYKLPDRVLSGAIVSGLGAPDVPGAYRGQPIGHQLMAFVLRRLPRLNYLIRRGMYSLMKADDATIGKKLLASFPSADQELLKLPENLAMLVRDFREGYRQGWHGPALDDITIFAPWGFHLKDIRIRFDVWQGKLDQNVPLRHGEYQGAEIPESRLFVLDGDAHLFLLARWREVLRTLIEP